MVSPAPRGRADEGPAREGRRASSSGAIAVALGLGIAHAVAVLAAGPSRAEAASGLATPGCRDEFLDGVPPRVPEAMARGGVILCGSRYTALTSTLTRTGIWSAERLEGWAAREAAGLVRTNPFHPEASLPHESRAELEDYRGSGLDRGHMTPNGDQPDEDSEFSSFDLGQTFPQAPVKNRVLWEAVEHAVRTLAEADGRVYVVTGVLFRGASLRVLNGRVFVPTDVWKAVWDPTRGGAGVYLTSNAEGDDLEVLSLDAFTALTGIDPFPALVGPARTRAALTAPGRGRGRGRSSADRGAQR